MAVDFVPTVQLLLTEFSGALTPIGLATLPKVVVTEPAVMRAIRVPEAHDEIVMVNVVPDVTSGEKTQPVAVPPLVKSPAASPSMDWEKVSVY